MRIINYLRNCFWNIYFINCFFYVHIGVCMCECVRMLKNSLLISDVFLITNEDKFLDCILVECECLQT